MLEENKQLDFSRLLTEDYFRRPEPAVDNSECHVEEAKETFEEIGADEIK